MKPLILILVLSLPAFAQLREDLAYATELRNEYVTATEGYIASLNKLLVIYKRSEETHVKRLAQARSQEPIDPVRLRSEERDLEAAKVKITEVEGRIDSAHKHLQNIPSVADIAKEHRRARRSLKGCDNWTLTAFRRQRGKTVTVGYKVVCQD
jgi:hypothetical protein